MTEGLPTIDFDRVGPALGDRFPDVQLPNQHGDVIDLHGKRNGGRALVAFFRSADW